MSASLSLVVCLVVTSTLLAAEPENDLSWLDGTTHHQVLTSFLNVELSESVTVANVSSLDSLNLSGINITAGFRQEHFEGLKSLRKLKHLLIANARVERLVQLRSLESLHLPGCTFSERTFNVESLAGIGLLDLQNTNATDSTAESISKTLITDLWIQDTHITPNGMKQVLSCIKLERVRCNVEVITDEVVEFIQHGNLPALDSIRLTVRRGDLDRAKDIQQRLLGIVKIRLLVRDDAEL